MGTDAVHLPGRVPSGCPLKPAEACAAWVHTLRSVAAGEISYADALARIPHVEDDTSVPSTFWSARDLLEQEVEFPSESPEMNAHFRSVMARLADRIEERGIS